MDLIVFLFNGTGFISLPSLCFCIDTVCRILSCHEIRTLFQGVVSCSVLHSCIVCICHRFLSLFLELLWCMLAQLCCVLLNLSVALLLANTIRVCYFKSLSTVEFRTRTFSHEKLKVLTCHNISSILARF